MVVVVVMWHENEVVMVDNGISRWCRISSTGDGKVGQQAKQAGYKCNTAAA